MAGFARAFGIASRLSSGVSISRAGSTALDGPILVLSPHFDDAALSCSALFELDGRIDLLTVMAGRPQPPRQGPWDALCGFADSEEAHDTREAEERRAFADSTDRVGTLSILEWQYQEGERGAQDGAMLGDAIRDWVDSLDPGVDGAVALPAGAGARWGNRRLVARIRRRLPPRSSGVPPHPDHLFVRDTALAHLRTIPGAVPLLYEELPYLLGGRADRVAAHVAAAHDRRASLLSLRVDRARKAARIAAYRSQLWSFPPTLLDATGLPAVERYWLLA